MFEASAEVRVQSQDGATDAADKLIPEQLYLLSGSFLLCSAALTRLTFMQTAKGKRVQKEQLYIFIFEASVAVFLLNQQRALSHTSTPVGLNSSMKRAEQLRQPEAHVLRVTFIFI